MGVGISMAVRPPSGTLSPQERRCSWTQPMGHKMAPSSLPRTVGDLVEERSSLGGPWGLSCGRHHAGPTCPLGPEPSSTLSVSRSAAPCCGLSSTEYSGEGLRGPTRLLCRTRGLSVLHEKGDTPACPRGLSALYPAARPTSCPLTPQPGQATPRLGPERSSPGSVSSPVLPSKSAASALRNLPSTALTTPLISSCVFGHTLCNPESNRGPRVETGVAGGCSGPSQPLPAAGAPDVCATGGKWTDGGGRAARLHE